MDEHQLFPFIIFPSTYSKCEQGKMNNKTPLFARWDKGQASRSLPHQRWGRGRSETELSD